MTGALEANRPQGSRLDPAGEHPGELRGGGGGRRRDDRAGRASPALGVPDGDWRRAAAGPVAAGAAALLVAHDWGDAARREPLTLDQALDAFTRAPLDQVEIDCDLKIAGREDEVVAALGERGLMERASISTMEVSSLRVLRELDPGLRLGWTVPKVTRDWNSIPWAKPLVIAGLVSLRRRLPEDVRRQAPELGVRLDLGLRPGDHRPPGPRLPRHGPRADRLDRGRPAGDEAARRPRGRRHLHQRPAAVRRAGPADGGQRPSQPRLARRSRARGARRAPRSRPTPAPPARWRAGRRRSTPG